MDNDSIRSVGGNALVEIWIEGRLRSICVTGAAIQEALGLLPNQLPALSDNERCEFVQKHMASVVAAARNRLRDDPDASTIVIDTGHLSRRGARRMGERRKTDRRKADRGRPEGDRRIRQRRTTDRRRPPAKPSDS